MKKTKKVISLVLSCLILVSSISAISSAVFTASAAEVTSFKDDFEGDLNWEILDHTGGEKLKQTNTYTAEADSQYGDANGNAFWGIKDAVDGSSKALSLRRSFKVNENRWTDAINGGEAPIAVLKDGILPSNYGVKSMSVKMYYDDVANYASFFGVLYSYNDKGNYSAIGMTLDNAGSTIAQYRVPAVSSGGRDRSLVTNRLSDGKYFSDLWMSNDTDLIGKDYFSRNQWITARLEYDFDLGCYTFALEGKKADGSSGLLKIKLPEAASPLNKIGLINNFASYARFDDVNVTLFDGADVYEMINALPHPSDITLDDEIQYDKVKSFFDCLTAAQQSYVENSPYLTAVANRLDELHAEQDKSLIWDDLLDFEQDENDKLCFEGLNLLDKKNWGIVDNPYKNGMNHSDKVLQINKNYRSQNNDKTGYAVYKIKDAVLSGDKPIANLKGKFLLSGNFTYLIFDYQDEDNWAGFQFYNYDTIGVYYVVKNGGSAPTIPGGGRPNVADFGGVSVSKNTWIEFNIEYSTQSASVSFRIADSGKEYTSGVVKTSSLKGINKTQFALATNGTAYFDDISLSYQGNAEYVAAKTFESKYSELLSLDPPAQYVSAVDYDTYNEMTAEYNAMSEISKSYLPNLDLKIEALGEAFGSIATTGPVAERDRKQKAAAEAASATAGYTYTFEDDFENGLSFYKSGYNSKTTGSVSIEYNEALGSNAAKVSGIAAITPKSWMLPSMPTVKTFEYDVKFELGAGYTSTALRQEYRIHYQWDNKDNADAKCHAIGFYKQDGVWCYHMISLSGYQVGGNFEAGIDLDDVLHVKYVYDKDNDGNRRMWLTIDDQHGNSLTYNQGMLPELEFAFGSRWHDQYIDNLKITYVDGQNLYSIDEENSEIIPYYSGNVTQYAGDYVTVQGPKLGMMVDSVSIAPLDNKSNAAVGYVSETGYDTNGEAAGENAIDPVAHSFNEAASVEVPIVQKTEMSVKFKIPSEFPSGRPNVAVYAVKLADVSGNYKIIYLNRPKVDYTVGSDGSQSAPGKEMRVIGENLAPDGVKDKLRAVVVNKSTKTRTEISVTKIQSNYSVSVSLPTSLANGEYELYFYNGYGDETAWSVPSDLTVAGDVRDSWPSRVYNIKEYGAKGDGIANDTPAFVTALSEMFYRGGGTLYLPRGVYVIEASLFIPENVRIVGENVDNTSFMFRPYKWYYNDMPSYMFIFESNVEFSNFGVMTGRSSGIFGCYELNAENLYFSNLYFYSAPSSGPATAPHGTTSRLNVAEYRKLASIEPNNPVLHFVSGSAHNVQIDNCDFSNVERTKLQRSILADVGTGSYWRVNGLITRGEGYEVVNNNMIWENCSYDDTNMYIGVWGHGVYLDNNSWANAMSDNRELYVADRGPFTTDTTLYKYPGDTTGTVWHYYGMRMQANICPGVQIYIHYGQGEGQSRTVTSVRNATAAEGGGIIVTIDEPFTIEPNLNSRTLIRRPRENITFYNIHYKNGSATGFYGGAVDVVWDNCDWTQVYSIYNTTQGTDMNVYFTYLNGTITYKDTGGYDGGFQMNTDIGIHFLSNGKGYSSGAHTVRGMKINGQTTLLDAKTTLVDMVFDKNTYTDCTAYSMGSSGFQGLLIAEETYNGTALFAGEDTLDKLNLLTNYNSAASPNYVSVEKSSVSSTLNGDVNGDGKITVRDSTYILYYLIGKIELDNEQLYRADVNGDGKVTSADSLLIKRYIVGILDDFKVNDPNFERVPIGGTKDDSGNLDFGEDGDSDGDYSGDYV